MKEEKPKLKKGFALQSTEYVKKMASKGGKSIPYDGRALVMDRELAKDAGRKGGIQRGINMRARRAEREAKEKENG